MENTSDYEDPRDIRCDAGGEVEVEMALAIERVPVPRASQKLNPPFSLSVLHCAMTSN